jgi:hypothetical protein
MHPTGRADLAMRVMSIILLSLVLAASPAAAQNKPADSSEILRAKVLADKKLLVAANMELTEGEAKGFWPIYEAYQADLQAANQLIGEHIKAYAQIYKSETSSEDAINKLLNDRLAIEMMEARRDEAFVPMLYAVLPPRKVMRYLQVEHKIRALVRFDLAAQIPLIH